MKKITLNQKTEVEIGEIVNINGEEVEVTQDMIDCLPMLFTLKKTDIKYWEHVSDVYSGVFTVGKIYKLNKGKTINHFEAFTDDRGEMNGWGVNNKKHFEPSTEDEYIKQELIKEAKERYPVGTVINTFEDNQYKVDSDNYFIIKDAGDEDYRVICEGSRVAIRNSLGEWAEILKLILTTEDGVDIYEGDHVYVVNNKFELSNYAISNQHRGGCLANEFDYKKTFSTKAAAQEYVDKNKVKTLNDYTTELRTSSSTAVYSQLETSNPRLFYIGVMDLIAKDLNEVFESENRMLSIYFDCDEYLTMYCYNEGDDEEYFEGIFTSKEAAVKCIEIMGEKTLNLIFGK